MNRKSGSFFCSWSGGKDSCLALYYAVKEGYHPARLITMLISGGERSHSHGLSLSILKIQSAALNIPFITRATGWEDYEENFISVLESMREEGLEYGVYGDIDIEDHRKWVRRVSSIAGIRSYHPLWKKDRRELVEEFIKAGFRAKITAVNSNLLGREFLGQELNMELLSELEKTGVDIAGENGEYHTVVMDGPLFSRDIKLEKGEQILRDGYWFQDFKVVEPVNFNS